MSHALLEEQTPEIRFANLADLDGIADLYTTVGRVSFRGLVPDSLIDAVTFERSQNRWRDRLAKPVDGEALLIATIGAQAIGLCQVYPIEAAVVPPGTGEVYVLIVHPDHERRGHGGRLLLEGLLRLRSRGCAHAILYTLENNERARRFYERQGWALDGGEKFTQIPDGTTLREVRYARSLALLEDSSA